MPADRRFLRRIALLNCHFARNLAYYRGGFVSRDGTGHLIDMSEVGRTVNGNFLDIAVLEWCKLFADWNSRHHWRRAIETFAAQTRFRAELLASLGIHLTAWESYLETVRTYRDKFVAHLDNEEVAIIPSMELALGSSVFLHSHLSRTVPPGTLESIHGPDIPRDLASYFDACHAEAGTRFTPAQEAAVPLRPYLQL